MTRRDPVAAALAQAQGLADLLDGHPDLQGVASLLGPVLAELRARAGLLPGTLVDPDDFEAGFSSFWAAYPVKVGKEGAKRAARRARQRPNWPGWQRIVGAVEAQKKSARWRGGTVPNPETWFNGGRWDDDPATMSAVGGYARAEDKPPAGYLCTPAEIRDWPRLDKWSREVVLERIGMEQHRRQMLQESGREEYLTS